MGVEKYDFSGYATKNNLICSDGRVIRQDAFKDNDRTTVPLVWNHRHDDPEMILGHALLFNKPDGVYAYCKLNGNEKANAVRCALKNGDIKGLSIYANQLKQKSGEVLHGAIKEVSLVVAGANPGALIDFVMSHSTGSVIDEMYAYLVGEDTVEFKHSEDGIEVEEDISEETVDESLSHAEESKEDNDEKKEGDDKKKKTVKEVFDSFTDEQKEAVVDIISDIINAEKEIKDDDDKKPDEKDEAKHSDEGEEDMKYNAFEGKDAVKHGLSKEDMKTIFADAKRYGSLRDAVIAHAEDGVIAHAYPHNREGYLDGAEQTYGIADIDYLFPEAKSLTNTPEFIKRDTEWVPVVMSGCHKSMFSRIKTMFADITADEARARGYTKGNLKLEEVFTLLKRTTTPQTVYKKQKLDRDDIIDITDFDIVAWIRAEMRAMLEEEIARAILVGDGRSTVSDDKIKEDNVRPIWKDEELFTIKVPVGVAANATSDDAGKAIIRAAIKARKDYKGSGNPTLFTTEDILTDMLLIEDGFGRALYPTVNELATKMRVNKIVTVPIMENLTRTGTVDGSSTTLTLAGLIVNLNDYNIGADKGGQINTFSDFDIDYNQEKYLIETRISGALVKPKSAIALETYTTS